VGSRTRRHLADVEAIRRGAEHVGQGRCPAGSQQRMQRREPLGIGRVEPQFTEFEGRRFDHLGEPLVEPHRQPSAQGDVGVGMPCFVCQPGGEGLLDGGHAGRIVAPRGREARDLPGLFAVVA